MPNDVNQTPEEIARDRIDARLRAAGWHVQDKESLDFKAGSGIAVREYQTDVGPADYVLFVDRAAVGVVEAKPDSWGAKLTTVEEQSEGYANAKLKWVSNSEPLPFLYECTGQITRFTNGRDPHPRSREVFTFNPRIAVTVDMIATGTEVKAMPVPICSPAEQSEIVRILDERLAAANTLEAEIDVNFARAEALRQSILKQAFSGHLVPQNPDDEPAAILLQRIKAENRSQKPAGTKRKAPAA